MTAQAFHRLLGAIAAGIWIGGFWGLVLALVRIGPTDIIVVWALGGGACTAVIAAFIAGLLSGDIT